jgi:hypothetical protein
MRLRWGLLFGAAMALSCAHTRTPRPGHIGSGIVSVTVVNRAPQAVCYMYISPVSRDTWGPDQLGDTETIAPGAARQFSLPVGHWDLRADSCAHEPIGTLRNALIAGDTVLTLR